MINLLGLIEMYNTYPHKDIYHDVAACLLKNFCKLDTMTSAQITELCNVSPSTLNRFFRMMDYPMTVSRLPDIIDGEKSDWILDGNYFPLIGKRPDESAIAYYVRSLQDRILDLHRVVDERQIKKLVNEIQSCKKIVFLGCPIPFGVFRFQMDLTLCGIESSAFMNPNYQYDELEKLEKGTIVFYTQFYKFGSSQYKKRILECKDRINKLVVLANNEAHPLFSLADYAFLCPGNGTEQDIVLMNIYINMIALTFRENN